MTPGGTLGVESSRRGVWGGRRDGILGRSGHETGRWREGKEGERHRQTGRQADRETKGEQRKRERGRESERGERERESSNTNSNLFHAK